MLLLVISVMLYHFSIKNRYESLLISHHLFCIIGRLQSRARMISVALGGCTLWLSSTIIFRAHEVMITIYGDNMHEAVTIT